MSRPTLPRRTLYERLKRSGASWSSVAVSFLLILITVTSWVSARDMSVASKWVEHTQSNSTQIERVLHAIREAEASQRGFILTGDPVFFRKGVIAEENARKQALDLHERLENPIQRERAAVLMGLIERRLDALNRITDIYQKNGLTPAMEAVSVATTTNVAGQIVGLAGEIQAVEASFLEERQARADRVGLTLQIIAAGGLFFALWLLIAMGQSTARTLIWHERNMAEIKRANDQLEDSMLHAESERKIASALAHFAGLLQGSPSVETAFQVSASSLASILPHTSGQLYLMRHSRDQMEHMADWGKSPNTFAAGMEPQDCWAMRQGRSFLSTKDGLICPHLGDNHEGCTTCVPLSGQGMDLGVLVVEHPDGWTRQDMAEAAAEQLALAVSNLRLRETLRTQSLRDPLTGLANRRELEEVLPREMARATRTHEPLSVLAFDIDHFKRFNDAYGHDAGDTLLRHFGKVLADNTRGEDLVVRLGGEEFALLMPNTPTDKAADQAERLRELVRTISIQHNGMPLGQVTTSIGVATYPVHARDQATLMTKADAALYAAKNAGRDRIQVANEL